MEVRNLIYTNIYVNILQQNDEIKFYFRSNLKRFDRNYMFLFSFIIMRISQFVKWFGSFVS